MERIICAAILFNDGKKHEHQPLNIDSGFVISGMRHHNCYRTLHAIGATLGLEEIARNKMDLIQRDCQGFITTANRFVDRAEGFLIAKTSNQFCHRLFDEDDSGILTSEDLY